MNVQKELEAQRKRVEALKYLEAHGQSITTRNVPANNANNNKYEEGRRDNTLEIIRKQQVSSSSSLDNLMSKEKNLLQQQNDIIPEEVKKKESSVISSSNNNNNNNTTVLLPLGWISVFDKATSKYYYWNKSTNVTTWEKPISSSDSSALVPEVAPVIILEENGDWIQKIHDASKQLYWQNKVTGEKCFDKDKPKSSTTSSSSSSSSFSSTKEKHSHLKASDSSINDKRRKLDIDPLDFTGGKVS